MYTAWQWQSRSGYGNGKQLNSLLNLKSIWKVPFNILISLWTRAEDEESHDFRSVQGSRESQAMQGMINETQRETAVVFGLDQAEECILCPECLLWVAAFGNPLGLFLRIPCGLNSNRDSTTGSNNSSHIFNQQAGGERLVKILSRPLLWGRKEEEKEEDWGLLGTIELFHSNADRI